MALRHGVLVVVLVLVAACALFEPNVRDGRYQLATVDGDKPPSLQVATIECDLTVDGGRLVLGPASQVVLELDERMDCARGGGSLLTWVRTYTGTYEADGARLRITVATISTGGLTVTAEGLVLEAALEVGGHIVAVNDDVEYASGDGVLRFVR